jgi:hypothetical protein
MANYYTLAPAITASVYGSSAYNTDVYNGSTRTTTTTTTSSGGVQGILQNTGMGVWLPLVVSVILIITAIALAKKPRSLFHKSK